MQTASAAVKERTPDRLITLFHEMHRAENQQSGDPSKENVAVTALENGFGLRNWVAECLSGAAVQCIRCATFSVGAPGILWLTAIANQCNAKVLLLSDVDQTDANIAPPQFRQLLSAGSAQWRVLSSRPGNGTTESGYFHPKVIIFDDRAAVVGSANLTGRALGLNVLPHHLEMSVGLRGEPARAAIVALLEAFERWWEDSIALMSQTSGDEAEGESIMPEYVAFTKRPTWGIGQVQTVGGSIFGQSRWLALSDVLPADPENLPAKIQVPQPNVESAEPVPWVTPAAQLAAGTIPMAKYSQDHFRRLCAYWLQAENRRGQLDSIPMLSLRHQASLVEHLMRRETPTRMLISDEVGLGKTVEIALLIERLRAANPELRVLYITLGGLVSNVADEFKNMGLDTFYVYGNQALDQQSYRPARLGDSDQDPRVIASLHRLAFGQSWEERLKSNAKWDVVVVDECHRLRMYGTGENQTAQKWFRVIERILTSHLGDGGRVYFLSGTPHQGNPDVFLNLAGLLCGLPRGATAKEQRRALGGRVIFRIKEEIQDWENKPLFPKRDIRDPALAPTSAEYNKLLLDIAGYFDWLLSAGIHLPSNTRHAIGFVKSNALQYAASSPKAGFSYLLRRYLRNFAYEGNKQRMENWASLLVPYRNRPVHEKPSELLDYLIKAVRQEEDEDEEEDAGTLTETVGPAGSDDAREEEKRRLGLLLDQYARLFKGPDVQAKFHLLKRLLEEADEPFVVFAQSLDTVYEIRRFLTELLIPCSIIVGGQDPAERKRQMENFRRPGRLGRRVLVSSSAGGEGINLQISRRLVHFDLPWNPMVLEQRIGRIHRIGTIDTVIVQTILLEGSREADIYSRLIMRLNIIVGALAQDPDVRTQYFRRILAGIPLETLRTLFSGERGDDDAIAAAVEEGKLAVTLVDAELRQHRVQLTAEDQGRATMERLVQLLLSGDKIRKINRDVKFTRVKFDSDTEAFLSEEVERPCYRINHGSPNAGVDWVVFDREAAAASPEVTRERTGGINHPLIALALRTLRTPSGTADVYNLAIGIGSYDRTSELGILTDGRVEPIAILTYLVAFNNGNQYFNHRMYNFAMSPTSGEYIDISPEGKLVEDIFWSQLEKDHSSRICPQLAPTALQNIEKRDRMFRLELEASIKDESGNWIGAIWPIGISLLMPNEMG
jgi:superfamily II DNA or RNA helicase